MTRKEIDMLPNLYARQYPSGVISSTHIFYQNCASSSRPMFLSWTVYRVLVGYCNLRLWFHSRANAHS
jgi:hypothetical protein